MIEVKDRCLVLRIKFAGVGAVGHLEARLALMVISQLRDMHETANCQQEL